MKRDEGRGRIAVVTGGASGIGLATADVLVRRGWRVVISDIDAQANRRAAGSIGAEAAPFDVVDEIATENALTDIEARLGPIEALFANARNIQSGGRPEDLLLKEFDRAFAVDLRGDVLRSSTEYYNVARTHLSVVNDAPVPRAVHAVGRIVPLSILGGLHHHYVRI
jgi:NAD(P)-dependent dehydrogenase (short-subunit alcohol dehydrogenase family)